MNFQAWRIALVRCRPKLALVATLVPKLEVSKGEGAFRNVTWDWEIQSPASECQTMTMTLIWPGKSRLRCSGPFLLGVRYAKLPNQQPRKMHVGFIRIVTTLIYRL